MWVDPPDAEDHVFVNAAERRPDLPSQWGRSLKFRVQVLELATTLEKVWAEAKTWM